MEVYLEGYGTQIMFNTPIKANEAIFTLIAVDENLQQTLLKFQNLFLRANRKKKRLKQALRRVESEPFFGWENGCREYRVKL